MEYKDLLGGKGANLAEMTSVLKLPVPPGFTISTDACRAYMNRRLAGRAHRRDRHPRRQAREGDGPPARRPRRSAARQRALRGQVLDARDDGHGPQPRPQRQERKGLASGHRRRALRLRQLPPVHLMYGRIVLGIDGEHFDQPFEEAKLRPGSRPTPSSPPRRSRSCASTTRRSSRRTPASRSRRIRAKQLRGAVEAVFNSWNGARAIAYRVRERISHDLGTAVNVQTMVFGNRDDNCGTGVGFTRNAATGENKPYGDFLVNAQGEDVVAGIRNTEDLEAHGDHFPKIHAELLDIFARLERHYRDMCDTEFTIEQGKLWMLQTRVGKRTGAAALRMAVEMTKGPEGAGRWKITKHEALHARHRRSPRPGAAPAVRAAPARSSPRASPRRRARLSARSYFTADDAADAADRGETSILVRNETSPEDVHGMMVSRGHPHRPRRPRQPRRRRRPRLGHAGRRRRRGGQDRGHSVHASATTVVQRGRRHLARRLDRRGRSSARCARRGRAAGRVRHDPRLGRRRPQGQARRAGQRRHRSRTPRTPASFGAEGIGLCRTEHMFLGRDRLPVVREMILADTPGRRRPRSTSWAGAADRLRGDPRRDGRPAGHGAAARPAAARVPAVGRGAARQAGHRGLLDARGAGSSPPPQTGPSTTR